MEDFNISKFGMKPRSVETFHGMVPQLWGRLSALHPARLGNWDCQDARNWRILPSQLSALHQPQSQGICKPKIPWHQPEGLLRRQTHKLAGSVVLETCLDSIGNWSKMEILLWNILISMNGIS